MKGNLACSVLQVGVGLVLRVPLPVVGQGHHLVRRGVRPDVHARPGRSRTRRGRTRRGSRRGAAPRRGRRGRPGGGTARTSRPASWRTRRHRTAGARAARRGREPSGCGRCGWSPRRTGSGRSTASPAPARSTSTLTVWSRQGPVSNAPWRTTSRNPASRATCQVTVTRGPRPEPGRALGRGRDPGPEQDAWGRGVAGGDAVPEDGVGRGSGLARAEASVLGQRRAGQGRHRRRRRRARYGGGAARACRSRHEQRRPAAGDTGHGRRDLRLFTEPGHGTATTRTRWVRLSSRGRRSRSTPRLALRPHRVRVLALTSVTSTRERPPPFIATVRAPTPTRFSRTSEEGAGGCRRRP